MRACGVFLLWATTAVALPAQTTTFAPPAPRFTPLLAFDVTDGAFPNGLVQATDGNLYGTTAEGGDHFCNARRNYGCGTVFKITTNGKLTTLYNFCPHLDCADGKYASALIQGTDGNFYGTTSEGGAHFCKMRKRNYGCGTIFRITPTGKLKTLYSFCPQGGKVCTDGAAPYAALIQASDGNFYGTTGKGGANNDGTIFKITPSGTLTTLHGFDGTDGATPLAGLVQATNGNFYGVTIAGGANNDGTIFKITTGGTLTILHSFCSQNNCADGGYAEGTLVQGTDGSFYGTTYLGGTKNAGTVFNITSSGTLTTLHSFDGADGGGLVAGLVRGTDGNFYGTTYDGALAGTIFRITPSGVLTNLYNFCLQSNCTDGGYPGAGLIQGTNGKFYGATDFGGANGLCDYGEGCGTIFSLSVDLGPFVETQPTFGPVGADVKILGTDLTGSTSVTFNDTAATFTVVSKSLITTTVPAGTTTGKVKVTLPHGTRSSNVPFQVK
jgi:uncharacterized repeat protein (TIGR03803 family)